MAVNLIPMAAAQAAPAVQAPQSRQMDLASMLLAQGGSTAPVNSTAEGIARALQGLAGGFVARREGEQRKDAQKELADALMRSQNVKPWTNPDTGQTAPGTDMSQMQALAQMLSGSNNEISQQIGTNVHLADIQQAQERAAQQAAAEAAMKQRLALMEAEYGMKPPTTREVKRGADIVTEQWNPETRKFEEVASGMRFAPPNSGDAPSNVREYEFFRNLPPAEQQRFMALKRANPYINLGDVYAQPDPMAPGQALGQFGVGLGPDRKIESDRVIAVPPIPGADRGGPAQPPAAVQPTPQPPVPSAPLPPMAGAPQAPPAAAATGVPPQMPLPVPQAPAGAPAITELPPGRKEQREIEEGAEKARLRQEGRARAGGTVIQDLQRGLDIVGSGNRLAVGAPAMLTQHIPESDAQALQGFIQSALSNVGLDTLQAMRESSPTGGALGQVPIQQQQRLEQVLGSLDITQRREIVEDNLKRVINIYRDIVYGTPEQVRGLVEKGEIDPGYAEEIAFRHPLSFDEFGRPVGSEKMRAPQEPPSQSPASGVPMVGGAPPLAPATSDAQPPRLGPNDKGAYDALPSGSSYIDPNGNVRTKP